MVPKPLKRRVTNNAPIMMGVVIVLVLALVAAGVFMELAEQSAYGNIERAGNFLIKKSDIYPMLIDMETSERGYIITGNESFLQPYTKAQQNLPALWTELIAQANDIDRLNGPDRPALVPLANEMRTRSETWQREAGDPEIAMRRSGRAQEAIDRVAAGTSAALFDKVRQTNTEVNNLISQLFEADNNNINRLGTLTVGLLAGLGGLVLVSAILTLRVARREAALQDNAVIAAESETQRLQTILENMPVAVRLVGMKGEVILQNRAAELLIPTDTWNRLDPLDRPAYFGFTRPDGTPLTIDELPDGRARRAGVAIRDFDLRISRPGTSARDLLINASPLKDERGRIIASVSVMQDVTHMKVLDQRKDEFIATAAHELRNPLAALSGYTQLLQRACDQLDPPSTVKRPLNEIGRQVKRLNGLVERLLDASRIQLGRLILDPAPMDLVQMARRVVADAASADSDAHSVTIHAFPDSIMGKWDPTRIDQVLTNLIGNALRYSPDGTEVKVGVEQRDGQAHVEVADQGPGVPPEQRPALFDRFYQASGASAATPGTGAAPTNQAGLRLHQGLGLGLYISSEIVMAHGGQIGMEPGPQGGSVFWFSLPISGR